MCLLLLLSKIRRDKTCADLGAGERGMGRRHTLPPSDPMVEVTKGNTRRKTYGKVWASIKKKGSRRICSRGEEGGSGERPEAAIMEVRQARSPSFYETEAVVKDWASKLAVN